MNDSTLTAVSASPRCTANGPPGEPASDAMQPCGTVMVVPRGPATWSLLAHQAEVLFGPSAPDWFALESDLSATRVKHGHRRSAWRVALRDGRTVYAKVFDDPGGSAVAQWRCWTHNTPAECEWRALSALRALNVPVVKALALGVRKGSRPRFVLLTESEDGATNLARAWSALHAGPPSSQPSRTNEIIEAVARLWAVSHDRGFAHPDGHPENVLVSVSPAGKPNALFVDVAAGLRRTPSLRRSKSVDDRRAIRSLAQLDQFFRRTATRTQRLRFWRCYWSSRDNSSQIVRTRTAERRLLHRLIAESAVHAATLARQRDRRMRRDGKYFASLNLGGGWHATVTLKLERRHLFSEPRVPDRSVAQWRVLLRSLIDSSLRQGQLPFDPTIRCVRYPPLVHPTWFIDLLSQSPARRVFERCHQLRHRDMAAPLALAYLERRGPLGLVRDSYLIVPTNVRS